MVLILVLVVLVLVVGTVTTQIFQCDWETHMLGVRVTCLPEQGDLKEHKEVIILYVCLATPNITENVTLQFRHDSATAVHHVPQGNGRLAWTKSRCGWVVCGGGEESVGRWETRGRVGGRGEETPASWHGVPHKDVQSDAKIHHPFPDRV
jgi:hypothetical protein